MTVELSDAQLLPGAARLAQLHAAELPQRDELCGAFCTLLALRASGVDVTDQDAIADLAGTVLAPEGYDHTAALPHGERGRRDYRLSLPVTDDGDLAGTSAAGLVRAVSEASGGERTAIPVTAAWDAAAVGALLATAEAEPVAAIVLNLATAVLWGSHPSPAALLGYLAGGDDTAGPASDWDVGHFTGCWGAIRGQAGTLVVIADTYPSLGWGGVYLQPIERVAASLRRDWMPSDGGALLILPTARAREAGTRLEAAGLEIAVWDNGSPDARAAPTS